MKSVADKRYRENQNTRFVFSDLFFPPKFMPFLRMWKKCGTAGQAIDDKHGAGALHAGYLRLHTHTQYM